MVLYKYCPACYSLSIMFDAASGNYICTMCGRIGDIKSDSIDRINEMKKSTKPGGTKFVESSATIKHKVDDGVSLSEKIKNKPGASKDFELV